MHLKCFPQLLFITIMTDSSIIIVRARWCIARYAGVVEKYRFPAIQQTEHSKPIWFRTAPRVHRWFNKLHVSIYNMCTDNYAEAKPGRIYILVIDNTYIIIWSI